MITVYGLKTCDATRKALRAHPGASLHDLRAAPLTPAELDRLLHTYGTTLVNQRSATWRGLDAAQRQLRPAVLLAAHPTLIKRPIVEIDGVLQPRA